MFENDKDQGQNPNSIRIDDVQLIWQDDHDWRLQFENDIDKT